MILPNDDVCVENESFPTSWTIRGSEVQDPTVRILHDGWRVSQSHLGGARATLTLTSHDDMIAKRYDECSLHTVD